MDNRHARGAGRFCGAQHSAAANFRRSGRHRDPERASIQRTKEALERQTATAEVLRVIAGSPSDVQPVFEAIATNAKPPGRGLNHSSMALRQ